MKKTEAFDPEETRWMRRAHGTLPSRKGQRLLYAPASPFRLSGFKVEKGEGLIITNIQVGLERQLIPKAVIPLMTTRGFLCEVCKVGLHVEVRFFNPTVAPIEYDFRAVGYELV